MTDASSRSGDQTQETRIQLAAASFQVSDDAGDSEQVSSQVCRHLALSDYSVLLVQTQGGTQDCMYSPSGHLEKATSGQSEGLSP